MTQHDRHLTTEQLSALLDRQLAAEEGDGARVHLEACEQCRSELAGLQQTVALLRALPQATLPRSFLLPEESTLAPVVSLRAPSSSATGRRLWSNALRPAFRTLSTLAAVLGLFFILTGLWTALPRATSGSAASMSSAKNAAPMRPADTGAASNSSAGTPTAQFSPGPKEAGQGQGSQATPQLKPNQSTNAAVPAANSNGHTGPHAAQPQEPMVPAPDSQPVQPVILFFNLATPQGRLGLGLLLLLIGIMGFILFKARKKYHPNA